MVKIIDKGLVCFLVTILLFMSTLDGCAVIAGNPCIANMTHKGELFKIISSARGSCISVHGGDTIRFSGMTIEAKSRYKFTIEADSQLYVHGFNILVEQKTADDYRGIIDIETFLYTSGGEIFPLSYASKGIVVGKKAFSSKINFEKKANTVLPGKVVKINIKNNNSYDVDVVGIQFIFSKNMNYVPNSDKESIVEYFEGRKSDFDNSMVYDLIYYSINDSSMKNVFFNLNSSHADEGEYISFLKSAFSENFK